jgi:hypothetical protein
LTGADLPVVPDGGVEGQQPLDDPGPQAGRGAPTVAFQAELALQRPEALATGADPLHLALVFNINHTNAMAYASAARNLCLASLDP